MNSDAGGFDPAYPPPAYGPPPGYAPGYPPPPPGYPPPGGYPPYGGYPPPGYPGYGPPPELKPGIIALRPLNMSDIFNGAFAYIRANPKATLGLTVIVIVIAQLFALLLQVTPLAAGGGFAPTGFDGEDAPALAMAGSTLGSLAGVFITWVSGTVLAGLLTVIIGRAIFGSGITIGEAWQRLRGRLWALLGFTVLEALGAVLLVAIVVGVIVAIALGINGVAAALVGIPLALGFVVAIIYLSTMLGFVPPLIVLERLPIMEAVSRSFALVRNDFWRVFGIRLLATLVAGMIAGAVSVPFSFGGQFLILDAQSTTSAVIGLTLVAVGAAIGQILTAPFTAGVVVLQYTDRRIRAEAFDLVLQTGAGIPPGAPADSTDHLWLTRHP